MKRLVLAAVGLSTVLLVPPLVAAQAESGPLVIEDPIGDVYGDDLQPADGPGFVDMSGLTVSLDGTDLVVHLAVAAPLPAISSSADPTVTFAVSIKPEGFRRGHVTLTFTNEGSFDSSRPVAWEARLSDDDSSLVTPLGDAMVAERSLGARVPLAALVRPRRLLFSASMWAAAAYDEKDPVGRAWSDDLGHGHRVTLQPPPEAIAAASADAPDAPILPRTVRGLEQRDIAALFSSEPPEGDLIDIRDGLRRYLADHPASADLLDLVMSFPDEVFDACDQELTRGWVAYEGPIDPESPPMLSSLCYPPFAALYMVYAQTGDYEVYGLLEQFIGATAPRIPSVEQDRYSQVLAAIPHYMEVLYPEIFAGD